MSLTKQNSKSREIFFPGALSASHINASGKVSCATSMKIHVMKYDSPHVTSL